MEKIKKKYSKTDCLILGIGFLILGLFVLSIAIPIVYVVLASFMDPTVLNNQGLSFHIKDWTLDAYRRVLENEMIWRGFLNSFLYSLAFTAISVYNVLWRWNDPDFYFNQSAAYGKYSLGSFNSWSI